MRIETIKAQIRCNDDIEAIKNNLDIYYKEDDYNEWLKIQQSEYLVLDTKMTFEEYLNETRILAPAEYYEGVLITPAITELIRTFVPITTSARIEDFLYPYLLEINKTNKENEIKNIQVITSSGKTFYADPESRTDLSDAISIMTKENISEYMWKTVNGFELVTIDEMIEARALGLKQKGTIIGVS